ncbi:expressed unknown protein [Ectocarpus siliculosus]|uniref:Uncharacterized protein n=1 Tax=Ectocarpus siliculosus TaxID=2880 RepID=D7FLT5_ECTSI|nr:expressed unknown protein [Ectocarpus siliculosus]|eukprot:CBJ29771.1 expressed unknown protein [Ectocarpus siliculosus]
MEREQAVREQVANRGLMGDSWVPTDASEQQLDDSFHPDTFVNVGNFLSSQESSERARSTSETSSQTPPPATIASVSTVTHVVDPSAPLTSLLSGGSRAGRIVLGLLAVVVMLLGTNAYSYNQSRAWKAETSSLREKVGKLEAAARTSASKPTWSTSTSSTTCPGSQLIDTCWFKVGWGDCANEALEDPVKPIEDAFRFALDSASGVIGAVTETFASDMSQVCDAVRAFGSYLFEQ